MAEKFVKAGIIEPAALKALLDSGAPVKILDASYVLPDVGVNPEDGWRKGRIADARFFDINAIADHTSSLPHMLPSAVDFAKAVGALGISNTDTVVIYGQQGTVMGPARAWWTFRAFGHDKVCVLDGGLPGWVAAGFPVKTAPPPPTPAPKAFRAALRTELVRSLAQVQEASRTASVLICDARPEGRFNGTAPEPRSGMRSGHIPGSRNIPAGSLVDPATGILLPDSQLEEIFKKAGFTDKKPVYATCGSGVTACMIALALHKIGVEGVAVYDGAWAEWGNAASGTTVSTSE